MVKKTSIFLLFIIYFSIVYAIFWHNNITCIFLEFLKFPCPGCGMTRALISLVNMDVLGAIKHNVVIFFMPYIFLYIFFDLKGKVHNTLLVIIAIITIINWIIKIILHI